MNTIHNDLLSYIKRNDNENATLIIINELAKSLVKNREDFIEVLRGADIFVMDSANDLQLIDAFIKNIPTNKKLLLGTSFLISHNNQTINFDGDSEIDDSLVKDAYSVLDEYFNAGGVVGSVADALGAGAKLTEGIMSRKDKRTNQVSDNAQKQADARRDMIRSLMEHRQKESLNKTTESSKNKQIMLIVGGVSLALIIGVGVFMAIKKR